MSHVWKWSRGVFPEGLVPVPGSAVDASAAYETVMRVREQAPKHQRTRAMAEHISGFDVATRTAMAAYLPVKELAQVASALLDLDFRPEARSRWVELGPPAAVLRRARTERVPVGVLRLAVAHAGSSVWSARWVAQAGLLPNNCEPLLDKIDFWAHHTNYATWRLKYAHRPPDEGTVQYLTQEYLEMLAQRCNISSEYPNLLASLTLPGLQVNHLQSTLLMAVIRDVAELQLGHAAVDKLPQSLETFSAATLQEEPSTSLASHVALFSALDVALGRDMQKWKDFVATVAAEGPHAAAVKAGVLA